MSVQTYEALVRPLLFSLPAEAAHHFALRSLRLAPAALLQQFHPPQKPVTVFGLTFPNPIGLAAGFDKNGVALPAWAALGFGFVEIGTVTARAQPGNPKPRIFRYTEQRALINRLGFNNDGADVIATRLNTLRASGGWPGIPIGINLGKSKVTPLEQAAEDYRYSFRKLHGFADFIVINVSSPNTPGLRSLQEHDALVALLRTIAEENRLVEKPVLLKIAPDLAEDDLPNVVTACEENAIAGIVATNTTLDHSVIPPEKDQTGGLSGAPLREKSTRFIRTIAALTKLPIIGVGGIMDGESAREKFETGAQLIELYTGFIYRGPALLKEIAEQL